LKFYFAVPCSNLRLCNDSGNNAINDALKKSWNQPVLINEDNYLVQEMLFHNTRTCIKHVSTFWVL